MKVRYSNLRTLTDSIFNWNFFSSVFIKLYIYKKVYSKLNRFRSKWTKNMNEYDSLLLNLHVKVLSSLLINYIIN